MRFFNAIATVLAAILLIGAPAPSFATEVDEDTPFLYYVLELTSDVLASATDALAAALSWLADDELAEPAHEPARPASAPAPSPVAAGPVDLPAWRTDADPEAETSVASAYAEGAAEEGGQGQGAAASTAPPGITQAEATAIAEDAALRFSLLLLIVARTGFPDERSVALERRLEALRENIRNSFDQATDEEPIEALDGVTISGSTLQDVAITTGEAAAFTGGLSASAIGIGTTSPSDVLALEGALFLAPITPADTAARLYNSGGDLYWNGSLIAGGAVGSWATDGTNVWRIGGRVGIGTSSPSAALAVAGAGYLTGALSVGGATVLQNATATALHAALLGLGSDHLADLTGAGLQNLGGALSLDATGNWAGTFDGLDGSFYLANAFSTSSAAFWETTQTARTADDLSDNVLDDLSNVDTAGQGAGSILAFDGAAWRPMATSSFVLAGELDTSSELAALLSDETGSGAAVFATSPTFAGVPVFSGGFVAQASSTVAGALAVTGPVGIGLSSPTDPLDINGNLRVRGGIIKQTDATTYIGLEYPAADNITLVTNGSERLRVTDAGNVGIGTTSPQRTLHISGGFSGTVPEVVGVSSIFEDDTSHYINVLAPNANESGILFGNPTHSYDAGIIFNNQDTQRGLQFRTGSNINRVTIDSSGDVGIGTTSPSTKLAIQDDTNTNILILDGPNGAYGIFGAHNLLNGGIAIDSFTANQDLRLRTQGSDRLTIAAGGNVGIGTTSPYAKLSITNTGSGPSFIVEDSTSPDSTPFIIDASGNVGIGTANPTVPLELSQSVGTFMRLERAGVGAWRLDGPLDGSLRLNDNGTDRVTFALGGNVGIGTTTPRSRLHVSGGHISIDDGYGLRSAYTANNAIVWPIIDLDQNNANIRLGDYSQTFHNDLSFYSGAAVPKMVIKGLSGNVGIGTTSPAFKLQVSADATGQYAFNDNVAQFAISGATDARKRLALMMDTTNNVGVIEAAQAGVNVYSLALNPNGGKVGIGTTSPASALQVAKEITSLPSTGAYQQLELTGSTNAPYRLSLGIQTGGSASGVGVIQSLINASSFTSLALNPSGGNVGIGTTSPGWNSAVANTSGVATVGIQGSAKFANLFAGGSFAGLNFDATGFFSISAGSAYGSTGTGGLIVSGSNNVAIGTTSPSAKLEVVKDTGTLTNETDYALRISEGTLDTGLLLGVSAASDAALIQALDPGTTWSRNLAMQVNGGNVGIGTTSPQNKLHIQDNNAAPIQLDKNHLANHSNYIVFSQNGSSKWALGAGTTLATDTQFGLYRYGFGQIWSADASGNVGIGTTSPWRTFSVAGSAAFSGLSTAGASGDALCLAAGGEMVVNTGVQNCTVSSARFKHAIESLSLDEAGRIVGGLRPVAYEYNGTNEPRLGLIAEEVDEVESRLVAREPDGTPRSVRYEELAAVLVKVVQDHSQQLATLAGSTTAALADATRATFDSVFAETIEVDNLAAKHIQASGDVEAAGRVRGRILCLEDVCVTASELRALLEGAGSGKPGSAPSEGTQGEEPEEEAAGAGAAAPPAAAAVASEPANDGEPSALQLEEDGAGGQEGSDNPAELSPAA